MKTFEEVVDDLLKRYIQHVDVNSSGYGDQTAYSVSKSGKQYPRAYLSLVDASDFKVKLTLTVTDKVKSNLSDRLSIQSSTLEIIRDLVMENKNLYVSRYDNEHTYEPTGLYQEDQTEGYQVEVEVQVGREANCDKFINE
jgi:hypothetical protein